MPLTAVRDRILEEFMSKPELAPAWSFFSWAYSDPSPLLLYDHADLQHILSSSEGGRQGDPLMPLAFSLLVQPLYSALVADDLFFAAVQDDFGILVPVIRPFVRSLPLFPLLLNFNFSPTSKMSCILSKQDPCSSGEMCTIGNFVGGGSSDGVARRVDRGYHRRRSEAVVLSTN